MLEIRRRREPSFKVPTRLIKDFSLSFSARRMEALKLREKSSGSLSAQPGVVGQAGRVLRDRCP